MFLVILITVFGTVSLHMEEEKPYQDTLEQFISKIKPCFSRNICTLRKIMYAKTTLEAY